MAVARFAVRRIAALVATLLVASVVIFGAASLAPGDPATLLAGGQRPNPQVLAEIRAQYHLDDPIWSQYWRWLTGVLTGDLGRSIAFQDQISGLIASRIVTSLLLVTYAAVLILGVGILSGLFAGLGGRVRGGVVTTVTTVLMAAPTYVVAIVLIWVFATKLTWFPIFGAGDGFLDRLYHLTLPAVALSCTYIAYVSRVTRTAVGAELGAEHVETARSRGLPMPGIVRRHVLRNAAAPILTVSGLTVAGLVAGTVVAEQAFGVSGLGSLLVVAAQKQDFVVVQDVSLLAVAAFVVTSTVVDVCSIALDPRLARKALA